jgi:hypothetical protein
MAVQKLHESLRSRKKENIRFEKDNIVQGKLSKKFLVTG